MKFTVEWQEIVYDAFDDLEHINNKPPFVVEADTIEDAEQVAGREAMRKVDEDRADFISHGYFGARVVSLTNTTDGTHRQIKPLLKLCGDGYTMTESI